MGHRSGRYRHRGRERSVKSADPRRVLRFQIHLLRFDGVMRRKPSGGRPSKGPRDLLVTRPAVELAAVVRNRADELEMSISDYIATVLAEAHGMPHAAPTVHPSTQQELPLKSA